MRHLIDAVRSSVREKNWYAALAGALVLPDIAAKLNGQPQGRARYIEWFNKYLQPEYTVSFNGKPHVFLSGEDCYALRCAYLHLGDFDSTEQAARKVLNRFEFLAQESGMICHLNRFNTPAGSILQLQVCSFCEEMCEAVERWLATRSADPEVAAALTKLPLIHVTPQTGVCLTTPQPQS